MESFYKICSDLDGFYGDEVVELGFKVENDKLISSLREEINKGKFRFAELREEKELLLKEKLEKEDKEKELAEVSRLEQEETAEKARVHELLSCAKDLHHEVKARYSTFEGKCKIDVSKLSDYEVLELKKREDNLHIELRELMDKISSFLKFIIPCGESAADLRKTVIKMRDDSTKLIENLQEKVGKVISDRDISEKKLKNSAGLNIELPKLKGIIPI